MPRLAIVIGPAADLGGVEPVLDILRRRRERKLESRRRRDGHPRVSTTARAKKQRRFAERMSTALALLKKARGTRGYLYEQPWYAIIGPPGAGKTTALLNSGLKFPLADEMGQGAVAGVGGTRLCDWWFTENAVLIDTAGRYTTQDSNAAVDRAGWHAFLDLLRRTRPRQPLNGVIVAIALSDIAEAPSKERTAHAAEIRRRIKELESRLGVRMPVYALFTKADLIAGFTDSSMTSTASVATRCGASPFRWTRPSAERSSGFRTSFGFSSIVSTSACSIACRPSRARPPRPDRGFPDADRHPRTVRCRPSSSRRSAAPSTILLRCCAASISPPERRKARRSTA